jgi:hypothetical protein
VRLFCALTAVALLSSAASWFVCGLFSLSVWPALSLNAAVSFVLPNLFYFVFFGRSPLLMESLSQIKKSLLPKARTPRE